MVAVVVVRVNLGYSSAGIYTNRESEDTGCQGHKRRMHAPTQHGACKIRMILVTGQLQILRKQYHDELLLPLSRSFLDS
jgi:hypothetical protein